MSLYIDLKYINYVGNRLQFFKRKNDYLFNFRCNICGDSATKKTKARGYFYRVKNDMYMKCHNCNASMHFGSFLKQLDQNLYSEYSFERYAEGQAPNKAHKEPVFKFTEPVVQEKEGTLLDQILDRVDTLPADHPAVAFCERRKIPVSAYKKLYYIDNIKDIEQLSESAKNKVVTNEPRIVMPFYDDKLQLSGVTCRAMGNESLRYLIVKVKEDVPLIFGIDSVDTSKHIYVTEGPIDSLFLPNAIAVSGTGFNKLSTLGLSKDKTTVVVDNQPRNKEVCKIISDLIDKDYPIVIWPEKLQEKDVNEIVLAGSTPEQVKRLIDKNTYRGLSAKAKFMTWRRV